MLSNKQGPNSSGLKQVGQLAGVVALHRDSEPQVASIFQLRQPGDLCFQMHPWRREHGENTQELNYPQAGTAHISADTGAGKSSLTFCPRKRKRLDEHIPRAAIVNISVDSLLNLRAWN